MNVGRKEGFNAHINHQLLQRLIAKIVRCLICFGLQAQNLKTSLPFRIGIPKLMNLRVSEATKDTQIFPKRVILIQVLTVIMVRYASYLTLQSKKTSHRGYTPRY